LRGTIFLTEIVRAPTPGIAGSWGTGICAYRCMPVAAIIFLLEDSENVNLEPVIFAWYACVHVMFADRRCEADGQQKVGALGLCLLDRVNRVEHEESSSAER